MRAMKLMQLRTTNERSATLERRGLSCFTGNSSWLWVRFWYVCRVRIDWVRRHKIYEMLSRSREVRN
jgi:hypothetical protein